MNRIDQLFLEAVSASLQNHSVNWQQNISRAEWMLLFQKAEIHHVLPLVYHAVFQSPAALRADEALFAAYKRKVVQQVSMQALRTDEFLRLYAEFEERQVYPLVVKGIICRSLYPNPDYRSSGDEDLLVKPRLYPECHKAMLQHGMEPGEKQKVKTAFEVAYQKAGSPLYIEMHKSLFAPDSEEYGTCNQYFHQVHEDAIEVEVQGQKIRTLAHTDHMFYLICHAFKHLLHGGFGIRQVCDMMMYANAFGEQIDWERVQNNCKEMHAEKFAVALFQIGEKYLHFEKERACYPESWDAMKVDEQALLEDLLAGGIYGGATMSRKHSSTMTLNAVRAERRGKKVRGNVWKAIFPSRAILKGKYTYLEQYPFLLPVAWTSRVFSYQKELRNAKDNRPIDSMRIGKERIALLKQYEII